MSIFHNQLQHAVRIIDQYPGKEPFHLYLKDFFRQHKQFGSRDRRNLAGLCYGYFRTGKMFLELNTPKKIILSAFLCETQATPFLEFFLQEENYLALGIDNLSLPLPEKINVLNQAGYTSSLKELFPFSAPLSEGINLSQQAAYQTVQPLLWIRVKPQYLAKVKEVLKEQKIETVFEPRATWAIGLPANTNLEQILAQFVNVVEVQDLSSQLSGNLYKQTEVLNWWDCCAASGGKSLLLLQHQPDINLHVSDIRPNTLRNLEKRFQNARVKHYAQAVADLTQPPTSIAFSNTDGDRYAAGKDFFDAILADVPCSGSGTWSRNPERLLQFSENELESYTERQQLITRNVLHFLKPGGYLFYSTCSVFEAENEAIVNLLCSEHNMQLITQQMTNGYQYRSDSMYIALLQKKP